MVGEESRPGKKLKKTVKVKKAERPPANPVVDVSKTTTGTTATNEEGHSVDVPLCFLLLSPLSSLIGSPTTWTARAAPCTPTSWRGWTGWGSPGLRPPTPSWPMRWVWARRFRRWFSSIHCTRRWEWCKGSSRPSQRSETFLHFVHSGTLLSIRRGGELSDMWQTNWAFEGDEFEERNSKSLSSTACA